MLNNSKEINHAINKQLDYSKLKQYQGSKQDNYDINNTLRPCKKRGKKRVRNLKKAKKEHKKIKF